MHYPAPFTPGLLLLKVLSMCCSFKMSKCYELILSNQTHHAISRAVEVLETTAQQKFPSKDKILHAYMHFEALTDHKYMYSCVKCGNHPAVVVMDLHKKAAFNMPGRSYQNQSYLIILKIHVLCFIENFYCSK